MKRYVLAVLWVALVTLLLWLLHSDLTLANFSLIYLLAVVMVAIYQGTSPSLMAAFLSFIAFNFFLVEPRYTFLVADPRDLLDLVVFLIVATIVGQLAARAKDQASQSRQHASEQEVLYRLTSSFNQLAHSEEVHQALKKVLQQEFDAHDVRILPKETPAPTLDPTTLYFLLRANEALYGTICAAFEKQPTVSQARLMQACILQAAMALLRIDLAERARRSKSLEEADQLKTALLHSVSHDLRTPITIIKTSANNLLNLEQSLSPPERHELVRSIETEADQLDTMVGNLLDMSRLQAGALQMNLKWNSLEEVAGDVAARVWQLTGQERVKIEFPPDFPLVRFDHGLILQVITNLVENSIRYEPPDSQIELRARLYENEVHMVVINHGPNLPPDQRSAIFEPFYHGQGGKTGLGLAIAKGIVEAHHGKIWCEDTPNGGVTFVFSLPYHEKIAMDMGSDESSDRR